MPKRKCRCGEDRVEADWYRARVAVLQGILRRVVELEDHRRETEREYERALMDARGALHLAERESFDDR